MTHAPPVFSIDIAHGYFRVSGIVISIPSVYFLVIGDCIIKKLIH